MRKIEDNKYLTHPLSVAPMMDWTTRHCRVFHRLLNSRAVLYTEMVTTGAILHGDQGRHLDFDASEHPLVLQLGGSDPADLAACAKIATGWGYDAINLNCGCPSERVQKGAFGACLMREPDLVADCVAAMHGATPLPVTVKCRIGVDDCDDVPFLNAFIDRVADAGCETFIVHARKAWLKGLSPKENREVPPLRYDIVADLKLRRPDLTIILNGGVTTMDDTVTAFQKFDGVMIGRAAYHNPYILAELAHTMDGTPLPARADIARMMIDYINRARVIDPSLPLNTVTRHMLGLYHGQPGARAWRRILTEGAQTPGAGTDVIEAALKSIEVTE
jgi:tRNA-dihydrouridine synthase A